MRIQINSVLCVSLALLSMFAAQVVGAEVRERRIPRSFSGGSAGADTVRLQALDDEQAELGEISKDEIRARLKPSTASEKETTRNSQREYSTPRSFSGGSASALTTARSRDASTAEE